MTTVPDREELRALYDQAVLEVDATRGSLTNDFYSKTGAAVFDGGYLAITDACGGTNARIHTIAAPVGAGKTSFSYALMAAFIRYAETHPDAPIGCAFVCDQIEKADLAFRELDALMPGKVAIWTTDHDKRNPRGEKVKNPAAVFVKDDLRDYPVIVVTHSFFNDRNGSKARYIVNRKGVMTRSLFIVDERPEEVSIYDTTLTEAQAVKEALTARHPETAGPLEHLLLFIMQYTLSHDGNTIIHPSKHYSPEFISEQLKWFRSEAAEGIRKANAARDEGERIAGLEQLFGFAYALSVGCGFVVPSGQIVRFVGWKSKLMAQPGMMLLDATADVDGVSLLCPWREAVPVPKANYANLEIIIVPQLTKQHLSEFFKKADNQFAYVDYMRKVVTEHMAPGDRGLVVCKKKLFDEQRVPDWGQRDPWFKTPAAYTEGFGWNIDGRELCAVHWGTGVGSNAWHTANTVFLFDCFYLPRRIAVATTQGLRGHKANQGSLATMTTINCKDDAVDKLADGHWLRHTKQMALRGSARCYDENGVCGKQRLVVCCDPKSFLEHKALLFPGAPDPIIVGEVMGNQTTTTADRVLDALSNTDHAVSIVPTRYLEKAIGKPWRSVSRRVLTKSFRAALGGLGWRYVPGRGRKGSWFERVVELRRPETSNEEDTAPRALAA